MADYSPPSASCNNTAPHLSHQYCLASKRGSDGILLPTMSFSCPGVRTPIVGVPGNYQDEVDKRFGKKLTRRTSITNLASAIDKISNSVENNIEGANLSLDETKALLRYLEMLSG